MLHSLAMAADRPVSRRDLIAVALVSATLLITELALTRIFSVVTGGLRIPSGGRGVRATLLAASRGRALTLALAAVGAASTTRPPWPVERRRSTTRR